MTPMKPINTSIFDFPTLIAKGCVYVDKTAQIYELVKPSADGIYFFPPPTSAPSTTSSANGRNAHILANLSHKEEECPRTPPVEVADF